MTRQSAPRGFKPARGGSGPADGAARSGPGRSRLHLALLAAALGLVVAADAARADGKLAVLELFTSQGCSSCPPADALIGRFDGDDRVLALSFPVDYWDYLGWPDTLARHEHTERQQAYADQRGDRSVYTPQIIINGRDHAVGSDRDAILEAVDRQAAVQGALPVAVTLSREGETITVRLEDPSGRARGLAAQVWLVLFNAKETVAIDRGENRGETITYTNVVRAMVPIGRWTGKPATLDVPRQSARAGAPYDRCAVLVQREAAGRPGPIIGVSEPMPLTGS